MNIHCSNADYAVSCDEQKRIYVKTRRLQALLFAISHITKLRLFINLMFMELEKSLVYCKELFQGSFGRLWLQYSETCSS